MEGKRSGDDVSSRDAKRQRSEEVASRAEGKPHDMTELRRSARIRSRAAATQGQSSGDDVSSREAKTQRSAEVASRAEGKPHDMTELRRSARIRSNSRAAAMEGKPSGDDVSSREAKTQRSEEAQYASLDGLDLPARAIWLVDLDTRKEDIFSEGILGDATNIGITGPGLRSRSRSSLLQGLVEQFPEFDGVIPIPQSISSQAVLRVLSGRYKGSGQEREVMLRDLMAADFLANERAMRSIAWSLGNLLMDYRFDQAPVFFNREPHPIDNEQFSLNMARARWVDYSPLASLHNLVIDISSERRQSVPDHIIEQVLVETASHFPAQMFLYSIWIWPGRETWGSKIVRLHTLPHCPSMKLRDLSKYGNLQCLEWWKNEGGSAINRKGGSAIGRKEDIEDAILAAACRGHVKVLDFFANWDNELVRETISTVSDTTMRQILHATRGMELRAPWPSIASYGKSLWWWAETRGIVRCTVDKECTLCMRDTFRVV